jgi:hypothetical protein
MAWYEIINAKSDSYIADRDAEDMLRQRSYWIPGSFETSSSMSAPSNALPLFRTL